MQNRETKQYETADNLNVRIALHEKYSTNKQGFHEWVFQQLEINNNMRILECGCGPGALWYKSKFEIQGKLNITLVDKSEGMLGTAEKNVKDIQNSEFRFIEGDIQKLPFENEEFDMVIAKSYALSCR